MSTDAELISDALVSAAQGPKSVASDAGTVVQQSLPDLIAADRYLRAKDAATKARRGLRFTKLIPPGNA